MKTATYALLLAAAASGLALGADTAYTTPVGYISHTISGTASSGQSPTLSIISATMVQSTEFAGQTSVSPSGLTTLTFAGGVPATFNDTYVLEISSSGYWSTVISSTATTITVNDVLPAGLPANTAITVRKHNTIKSLFGANAPGLAPFDGTSGDEIQILTPSQSLIGISWVTTAFGVPADGWYDLVSTKNEDNRVIEPGSAVLVKTKSATNLSFTSAGTVKTTPTQIDVYPNLTLVGQVDAVGATLGEMNFSTQLVQFNGANTDYDELQFLSPAQVIDANVALAPGVVGPNPQMANFVTTANADSVPFPTGTGVIIKRNPAKAASVITVPGATVAP